MGGMNTTNKKPANGQTHEGANPACEEKWVHVHAALCASGCEALRDQAVVHGLSAGLVGVGLGRTVCADQLGPDQMPVSGAKVPAANFVVCLAFNFDAASGLEPCALAGHRLIESGLMHPQDFRQPAPVIGCECLFHNTNCSDSLRQCQAIRYAARTNIYPSCATL
jgi:hypothetical protein